MSDAEFIDVIRFPKELRELLAASQEKIDLSYQRFVRAVFVEGLRSLGLLTDKIASLGMGHASIENVKPTKGEKVATFKDLEDLMREVKFLIQESNINWGDALGDSYKILAYPDTIEEGDMLTAGGPGCGDWVVAWPEIIGKPIGEFTRGKACRCVARLKPPYGADNLPLSPPGLPNGWFYMGGDDVLVEGDKVTLDGWDSQVWHTVTNCTWAFEMTVKDFMAKEPKQYFAARYMETSLPSDGTSQQEAAGGVL